MTATPPPDAIHRSVEAALERAIRSHEALLRRATRLVAVDEVRAGAWAALRPDEAARDEACHDLGVAILTWVRSGGRLELVELGAAPLDGDVQPGGRAAPAGAPGGPPRPASEAGGGHGSRPPAASPDASGPAGLDAPGSVGDSPAPSPLGAPTPAAPADIAALASRWAEGAPIRPTPQAPSSPLERLGPLPDLTTPRARKRELTRLHTEAHQREGWSWLSAARQRALVAHIAARAHDLQGAHSGSLSKPQRGLLAQLFAELTRFQTTARPGFVHGLRRNVGPQGASWRADAEATLRELDVPAIPDGDGLLSAVEEAIASGREDHIMDALDQAIQGGVSSRDSRILTLADPFRDALEAAGRCKTLRKALASMAGADPTDDATAATDEVPAAAPDVLEHTRGRKALIVGGDRIGRRAARLEAALGLTKLDWDSGHSSRRVASLSERVAAGTYDLVILLQRYLSHKVTDLLMPSLKAAEGTLVVWCERGSGLPALERAVRDATSCAPRALSRDLDTPPPIRYGDAVVL